MQIKYTNKEFQFEFIDGVDVSNWNTRIMVYNGHLITATLGESRLLEIFNGISRVFECEEQPHGP